MQVSSSAEPPLLMLPLHPQGSAWRSSPCCSSLEAKGRTGARRASFEVPQRYQDCILEVALPGHCGPSRFGEQTAGEQPALPGPHRPWRGQPGAEGSLQQAEHPLQHSTSLQPGCLSSALRPPRNTAPANIYPPRSGVYKTQLISVCNMAMSLSGAAEMLWHCLIFDCIFFKHHRQLRSAASLQLAATVVVSNPGT